MVQGRRLFCWLAHETDFYPHLMNTQNKKRTTIICEVNGVGYFVHLCMGSVCVNAVARVAHAHADTYAICSRVFHSTLFFFSIYCSTMNHTNNTHISELSRQDSLLFCLESVNGTRRVQKSQRKHPRTTIFFYRTKNQIHSVCALTMR